MRRILVTGTDTGVGKTHVVAALARLLAAPSVRIRIVKAVETGINGETEGDAARAARLAGGRAETATLEQFTLPLTPLAAAAAEGRRFSFDALVAACAAQPESDWQIVEGAGGLAVPLDPEGRDWTDFAEALGVDEVVLVVADRLGAINQARLAHAYATSRGLRPRLWLNATSPIDPAVAAANREGLRHAGLTLFAEQAWNGLLPAQPEIVVAALSHSITDTKSDGIGLRCRRRLAEREALGLRRTLRVLPDPAAWLNLADNDYLGLATDPVVRSAAAAAVQAYGTSASASPLISGWRQSHADLVEALCAWHDFPCGLLWSSGFSANAAVLAHLPQRGDLVLADRLIHHSMIAGLLRSGARLQRYTHLQLDALEASLIRAGRRPTIVVTESVFSMDGDYPDLRRLAELKRRHGFLWVLDEAHGLGWYGPEGAGLASAQGVASEVDILVGTLGKTLGSAGAYTLFRDPAVRDDLMNRAGEFIYSTALPPAAAAAAYAAIHRVSILSVNQSAWQAASRRFRQQLQAAGWNAPDGDSPIVPVMLKGPNEAVALAEALREACILAAPVRPPTVPAGTSRLRFSLRHTFGDDEASWVLTALAAARDRS